MYQECRLVHADLSEYNSIVHQDKLYIIDVSQSVEHEHPMSLDFLRMDIKNVNDFFNRKMINVYPEKSIFKYIIENNYNLGITDNSDEELGKYLDTVALKDGDNDDLEDEVFRSVYLVRDLNSLDESDFSKFSKGQIDTLTELVGKAKEPEPTEDSESEDSEDSEDDSEYDSDEESEEESDGEGGKRKKEKELRGKRYEDKDEKKQRKEAAKLAKQEKRKTKMKKHVKKKIVNKRKGK